MLVVIGWWLAYAACLLVLVVLERVAEVVVVMLLVLVMGTLKEIATALTCRLALKQLAFLTRPLRLGASG